MATMEKPKTKKKTKLKPLVLPEVPTNDLLLEVDDGDEEEQQQQQPLETVDIDFPSTSTSEETPPIVVPPEVRNLEGKEAREQDNGETVLEETAEKSFQSDAEEVHTILEATAPSAPMLDDNPVEIGSQCLVQTTTELKMVASLYPNLQEIRIKETIVEELRTTLQSIKPFTREQLAQFYRVDTELALAEAFEREFLTRELEESDPFVNHPLYQLLQRYAKARADISLAVLEFDALRRKCKTLATELWVIQEQTFTGVDMCGDGKVVRASCRGSVGILQETALAEFTSSLKELVRQSCFQCNQCTYEVDATRIKIEQKIYETLNSHPILANLPAHAPVVLNPNLDAAQLTTAIGELRLCISILFSFLRKGITDKRFLTDVRSWTVKLVATQLRIATTHDHLFVLFHVLRSPSGIASWATRLVQLPRVDDLWWGGPEFQHILVVMASILLPIKKRNEFLEKLKLDMNRSIDVVQEEMWAIVDSDGEDCSGSDSISELKEGDLVALIDQVPFGGVFRAVTLVSKRTDGSFRLNEDAIRGSQLLKSIAFGTVFVELLGNGLVTYDADRYRQFAKRLARLIKHTVFYVSDLYRIHAERSKSANAAIADPSETARIELEMDVFIVRSAQHIYRSRKIGTWQYLTGFPFDQLSIAALWKLYYCLHLDEFNEDTIASLDKDFRELCVGEDQRDKFRNNLLGMPSEDLYYLLQVFSNMALARESCDMEFIQTIALNLFDIGYLNEHTKDFCYKAVKDLLFNIVFKYPSLVSSLLQSLKQEVASADHSALYIFKSLPLDRWRPQWEDFELLANWILNYGFDAVQSSTARVILIHLNYNFDQNNELFLPHDIHVRIACLVTEVYSKHVPEILGSSQGLTASVSSLVKNKAAQEQFLAWCWNMVSLLRLHCMDQSAEVINGMMKNPALVLRYVLELERAQQIYQGVTENRPLAIYLAILISTWGHSVPQICHKGFEQIRLLLNDHRYAVVVRCLQLITPLFLECPDSLSRCEAFKSILTSLIAADRSYARFTKDQFRPDAAAPVTEMLKCMILTQITGYTQYGLNSPNLLINVWLQCFAELPNWTKDGAILRLLDAMLGVAYQFPDAWHSMKEFFRPYYSRFEDIKASKPSGLLNLLSSTSTDLFTTASPSTVFLSIFTLELEYEITEIQTRIWHEVLRAIGLPSSPKLSLDTAIKKSTSILGYPSFSPNSLTLFKLANLVANCSIKNYMYPIVCQLFFAIYLSRVPLAQDEERFANCFGISDRFYEYNVGQMKRIKKQLYEAESYYNAASVSETDDRQLSFYNHCTRLFKTLQLWLEDTQLNRISIQSINLPPQFDCHRLASIFRGNRDHWTEFIDLRGIRSEHRELADNWQKLCYRYKPSSVVAVTSPVRILNSSVSLLEIHDPKQAIYKRLEAYDAPVAPPSVFKPTAVVTPINFTQSSSALISTLKSDFSLLDSYARKEFHVMYNEHQLLDTCYLEQVRKLYITEEKIFHKDVSCGIKCLESKKVLVKYKVSRLDKNLSALLAENRSAHDALLQREAKLPERVVMASVRIDAFLRQIVDAYQEFKLCNEATACAKLNKVGTTLFYEFVDKMNDYNQLCPLTKEVCSLGISQLGFFMQENQNEEGIKLLDITLKRPDMINLISELLVPANCPAQYFLRMYGFIIDSHIKRHDTQVLFVLLSKFDIVGWMNRYRPKLVDVNHLAELILRGLEGWNQQNAVLIQNLLQRHLMHLFEYDFPEHYGDILQMSLAACSRNKIMPQVLLDLINSMRRKVGCQPMAFGAGLVAIKEDFRSFATKQNILSYKDLIDTTILLTQHFQQERLSHGLHGLYPKHSDYCEVLSLLLGSIGHAATVAAVHTYPGVLADELINWLWPSLCDMFSPWLIPYFPQNMKGQQQVANWIQQVAGESSILPPWSELHADTAFRMVKVFEHCLQYLLDTFPSSGAVLGHIFYWYELNFAHTALPRYVAVPIHTNLMNLAWDRFRPAPVHVTGFSRILQQFIPESHMFIGHIFIRIVWTPWLQQNIQSWDYQLRYQMLSSLLMIFIKISYEPNAREGLKIVTLLQEACNYPWHMLEYQGVEAVLDWFVLSAEPSVVLKMPSEVEVVDSAVLDLLQVASSMKFNPGNPLESSALQSQVQAKRILYVRTAVRLLNACGAKYQKLLGTKQGVQAFHNAVLGLLNIIETVLLQIRSIKDREFEARNLTTEVIVSLQSQGEYTSKLFIEAIVMWTENCRTSDSYIIPSILDAIGMCKSFTCNLYSLLEEMIFHYFGKSWHGQVTDGGVPVLDACWTKVLHKIGPRTVKNFDEDMLVKNRFLLVLHLVILQRLQEASSSGDRILVLQKLFRLVEELKVSEQTEPKLVLLWALMVVVGVEIMKSSSNSQNHLLTLARYLQTCSKDAEGWGEGLLGAIGIRKDGISIRRKVLAKCLSCIVFLLFGEDSGEAVMEATESSGPLSIDVGTRCKEYAQAIGDLKQTLGNKRYAEMHIKTRAAINLIENTAMVTNIGENVCKILRLFCDEHFFQSVEEVWRC